MGRRPQGGQGQHRTGEIPPSGIAGGLTETWAMEKAKRARKAETPKQPSLRLRFHAPYLYPDRWLGQYPSQIRPGGASNLTGRSNCEPVKPRNSPPRESDCGMIGSVEPVSSRRRPRRHRDTGQVAMFEFPGVGEDGMSGRNVQRKLGTTRGSPRRSRTAKASRISRLAVKSWCAREWGGWGRLSEDGPGQHNPDRSEGPWGKAEDRLHGSARRHIVPDTEQGMHGES